MVYWLRMPPAISRQTRSRSSSAPGKYARPPLRAAIFRSVRGADGSDMLDIEATLQAAGCHVPVRPWHALRHTFASHYAMSGGSLLALMFNLLWCKALNRRREGVTHFAMHHSDIQAPAGWVDTLLPVSA